LTEKQTKIEDKLSYRGNTIMPVQITTTLIPQNNFLACFFLTDH